VLKQLSLFLSLPFRSLRVQTIHYFIPFVDSLNGNRRWKINIGTMQATKAEADEAELERILKENRLLQQENEIFSSYLTRVTRSSDGNDDDAKRDKRVKRKLRTQALLTLEQKNQICSAEYEEKQKETADTKINSEKLIDTLRAVLEETDLRIAELKKDAYEFKRDIVVGAENFRNGKTMAEKVVKYMEDKLRQKDAIIEKLRLKNATIKSQIQKVNAQLKQKEEMGDVLHYIDFHQLQIENKQYVAKIDERNQELLKLKMTTGNTVQILNTLKKTLTGVMHDREYLKKEIEARKAVLKKIKTDMGLVDEEMRKEEKTNKAMAAKSEQSSEMPHVLDYVAQKAEMYELEKELRNWERKLEIAEMDAKRRKAIRRRQGHK